LIRFDADGGDMGREMKCGREGRIV